MSAFLDKVGSFFFKPEEEEDIPEEANRPETIEEPQETSRKAAAAAAATAKKDDRSVPRGTGKLISVPAKNKNSENLEIVLFKASAYDDMQEIARQIKERKVAVVNFEDMDKAIAQRMVDFLSGAAFALDGAPRKVSGGTFIFSSSQVDISGQIMASGGGIIDAEELSKDERFSSNQWLRS